MNSCTAYISSLTTKIYLHGIHHHENDKYHEWKPLSWLYYDDMLFFGFSNNYSRHLDKYETFLKAILVQSACGVFG